jgi:asparaginyl-tRNA synthetase
LLQHISGTVKSAANSVANNCQAELALFNRDPGVIRDLSFSRVSYTDAINLLVKHFPELKWGDDLKSEHEKTLAAIYGPVFVHRYSESLKFFNMKPDPEDPKVVLSADLLLPGVGESAGAAERATDLATIKDRLFKSSMYAHMKAMGIKDEEFDWYLNYHRDNTVAQHSGTGIGMARVAQFILGLDDIRDAVPFLINSENLI